MKIIVVPFSNKYTSKEVSDCLLLFQTKWDDYGVKSSYSVSLYISDEDKYITLGEAKIISTVSSDYNDNGFLNLSGEFEKLPDSFGFLGQSNEFYERLVNEFQGESESILENLNDLSTLYGIRESFELLDNFNSSLIRYSDAERAYNSGWAIVNKKSLSDSFSFEFSNGNDGNKTKCSFDFDSSLPVRSRLNVIIGENGTGKTTYLADLALSMSGRENKGDFTNSRPLFSKVIAVSFSSFDNFEIPREKKSFSYKYCGLRDKDGFMSRKRMLESYKVSCDKILKKNLRFEWNEALNRFIDDARLEKIDEDFFENKVYSNIMTDSFLSSGESIVLYTFTQVIAEASKGSLILFDEPELHLHPQSISNLIPTIKDLLNYLGAYAIIATHSPIIVQQIPSKFVRVFDKTSGRVCSRGLEIETLGENLNTITLEVFKTIKEEHEYKKILYFLHSKMSVDKVNEAFNNNLSLNGQLYLQSLEKNEK